MYGVPGGYEDELEDEYDFDSYGMEEDDYIPSEEKSIDDSKKSKNADDFSSLAKPSVEQTNFSLKNEHVKNAILRKNVKFISESLDNGFPVDSPMSSGWTSLMYASTNGFLEIVKLLIQKGANVNFRHDMFTPLMACCYSNTSSENDLKDCVKCLLEHGAKPNFHDSFMMTALMYASRNGFSSIVTMLCENHADVDRQDSRGWTAMHFAASKGYANVVKELLRFNANRDLASMEGQKACDTAFEKGFLMLSEMLENYDPNKKSQYSNIPDKMSSKKTNNNSNYVLYDDLEVFLHGLQLGHCTNIFKDHHLTLQDLMKIEDAELVEIGIKELGIRKKLLQAVRSVHTNEWDMSSVKATKEITKLTTLECGAVIANVSKHITHINSSLLYLYKQIEKKKDILASDDTMHQQLLITQLKEATKVIATLEKNMANLNSKALQVYPHYETIAPNVLMKDSRKPNTQRSSLKIWVTCSVVVISCVTGVFVGWKKFNTGVS